MPRLSKILPRYCRHRGSGQAVVTLNGRDIYLGRCGSRVSRLEYGGQAPRHNVSDDTGFLEVGASRLLLAPLLTGRYTWPPVRRWDAMTCGCQTSHRPQEQHRRGRLRHCRRIRPRSALVSAVLEGSDDVGTVED